ncbi:MAG: preprotein translocase subunit YajC, partial [Lautropia sp.]
LYYLMLRPQMTRAKEHRTMLGALQKGDEVITAGGVVGRIVKVGEAYVTVEVGAGEKPIELQLQKASVQTLLPKGTIKAI